MRLAQYFSAHIIFVFPSSQVDNQDSNKNNQQSLCSSLNFPSPFFCTIKYPENYTIKSSGHYYFYDQVLWTFLRLINFQQVYIWFNQEPIRYLRQCLYLLVLYIRVLDYLSIFMPFFLTYYICIRLFYVGHVILGWRIWYPLEFLIFNRNSNTYRI